MYPILYFCFLLPFLLSFLTYKRSKEAKLPPSPPKLPFIGNLHQLGSHPHRSLNALAQRHGPLMYLKLGAIPTIVVSSGEMAQEIMKKQDHIFASRPSLEVANKILYDSKDVAFAPYGEYWRHVKKISILNLLSTRKVQSFRQVREEEVALVIEKIKHESSKGLVNLSKILNSFSNDVACRVTLGKKYTSEEDKRKFFKLISESTSLLGAFHVGDFFPSIQWVGKLTGMEARMKKNCIDWDEFLCQVIDDHLHGKGEVDVNCGDDFVDVLLLHHKDQHADFALAKDDIKAIIMDMFAAGTDTSYITMEWTMAELIRNPMVMKNVQEEIKRIVGRSTMVEEKDVSQMFYLRAVIKEVLRLHPPAPLLLPRESIKATQVQGYEIPAKTRVIINAWAIGRNPSYWEAHEEFQPERFLNSSIDFKGHDFHYIPFGAGRRICPGILFAISTVELALANLLHHFEWKLQDGKNPKHLDMSECYGLTTNLESNLFLLATPMV